VETTAMKIILLNPGYSKNLVTSPVRQWFEQTLEGRYGTNIYNCPPLSLYLLAAFLPDDQIVIIDESRKEDWQAELPADLLLVTSTTHQAERACEIGEEAKKHGIPAIIGGIHATVRPEEFTELFDSVVSGEVEEIFPTIINDFRKGQLKPRYQQIGEANLDISPVTAYEKIPQGVHDFIPFQLSRGCPLNCAYCASTNLYGRKIRCRSQAVVAAEIAKIAEHHPGIPVYITDDNFLRLGSRVEETLQLFHKFGIRYICYGDVTMLDNDEILHILQSTRCIRVLVGLDSLVEKSLTEIAPGKITMLKEYQRIIEKIQSRGIGVFAGFVVGFDPDTVQVFEQIKEFVDKTLVSELCISMVTPLPGTRFFEKLQSEGRILSKKWSQFDGFHPVFSMKNLTIEEVQSGIKEVMEYYLRPELRKKRSAFFKEIFRARLS
jgi:radical SAM superfamily enzyme YgiQ (UPF0313 family)